MKFTPHNYQREMIKKMVSRNHAAILAAPGVGKTSATLAAVLVLLQQKLISKVLIVAPLRVVYSVWPREIKKWTEFNHLRCVILHGDKKEELLSESADIFLINYEALPWLVAEGRLKKLGADMLVWDEVTRMKNSTSKRFKAVKPHLKSFRRRVGLTGSPVPNGLLDLFGQCFVIDEGNALGRYITHYRMTYFDPCGFMGYDWRLKPGAEQQIYEAIAPMSIRVKAEDNLDLPELVENDILVELPASVMKTYKEMDLALITSIQGQNIFAPAAAAAVNKCQQIANGGIYKNSDGTLYIDKSETWINLHNAKTEALCSLVEELQGSPILVAYNFKHDLSRIQEALGPVPYIGGGVSAKKSDALVDQWNRGELPVLCAHPASAGHGINLQGGNCNHVCFYSMFWDLELYEQFVRRVYRQGHTGKHVFVHHIIGENTVDEAILKAIRRKDRTQTALLDALRDYAKERY